jgi:hypothetical protein
MPTQKFPAALGILLAATALAGCEEKKTTLAPAASSLAPSVLAPSAKVKKFVVDEGKASLEMEAPKETIKATATSGPGALDVDFADLTRSRGEVKIDLTTLTTATFAGKEADNASQTAHARTWLEVADGKGGKLDEKVKEANRYAVYAIRSIENASATDVAKVAVTKDGADEVRTVALTTRGELLVHGHKVEREAELDVGFRYDAGADADRPRAITIKTRKPFRVVLADHDVKPRDDLGKIAKGSFHLLGTKVADNADITLDLRAKPRP